MMYSIRTPIKLIDGNLAGHCGQTKETPFKNISELVPQVRVWTKSSWLSRLVLIRISYYLAKTCYLFWTRLDDIGSSSNSAITFTVDSAQHCGYNWTSLTCCFLWDWSSQRSHSQLLQNVGLIKVWHSPSKPFSEDLRSSEKSTPTTTSKLVTEANLPSHADYEKLIPWQQAPPLLRYFLFRPQLSA